MEKTNKNKIKRAFYSYPKFLKQAVQSTVDFAEENFAVDYSKVSVQSSKTNAKETKLCAIIDNNLNTLRWCYVVEKVLDHYHFEKDKVAFINTFYFKGKSDIATCMEVGICRQTLYNWQNEVLEIAYKWAKEYKVI